MWDQGGTLSQRGSFRESVPPPRSGIRPPLMPEVPAALLPPIAPILLRRRSPCQNDVAGRPRPLDQAGQVVRAVTLPCAPQAFLDAIAPYRDDLVVCCECLFCWYWLADLCAAQAIPFVLGHALYMKAIHGGKAKNDRIDAAKIARLLKGGNLPQAYGYPAGGWPGARKSTARPRPGVRPGLTSIRLPIPLLPTAGTL